MLKQQKEKKEQKRSKNIIACSCCHTLYSGEVGWIKFQPKTRKTAAYICPHCMEVKSYHAENETVRYSNYGTFKDYTYSFELEGVPYNRESHALMISEDYQMLPTYDGSLPFGGVEYKTLIYPNLHGVKAILKAYEECVDTSDEKCGSHINIGHVSYVNDNNMELIRSYAHELFDKLYNYMADHEAETIKLCGRYFTNYACYTNYTTHVSWINLSYNNRVEFRISKFITAKQYFWLINMWHDMLDVIFKKFLASPCKKTAEKVSDKLVDIFIKYSLGQANCQRPERNSK